MADSQPESLTPAGKPTLLLGGCDLAMLVPPGMMRSADSS